MKKNKRLKFSSERVKAIAEKIRDSYLKKPLIEQGNIEAQNLTYIPIRGDRIKIVDKEMILYGTVTYVNDNQFTKKTELTFNITSRRKNRIKIG